MKTLPLLIFAFCVLLSALAQETAPVVTPPPEDPDGRPTIAQPEVYDPKAQLARNRAIGGTKFPVLPLALERQPPSPPGFVVGQASRLSSPVASPILTGNKKVMVAFNPSTDPVDGYKIYYSTVNGQSNTLDIGLQLSTIITTLLPDAIYYFYVTAYSGDRESVPSNEVRHRTPPNTAVIVRHFGPTPSGPWTRILTNRVPATNAQEYYMHTITIE